MQYPQTLNLFKKTIKTLKWRPLDTFEFGDVFERLKGWGVPDEEVGIFKVIFELVEHVPCCRYENSHATIQSAYQTYFTQLAEVFNVEIQILDSTKASPQVQDSYIFTFDYKIKSLDNKKESEKISVHMETRPYELDLSFFKHWFLAIEDIFDEEDDWVIIDVYTGMGGFILRIPSKAQGYLEKLGLDFDVVFVPGQPFYSSRYKSKK